MRLEELTPEHLARLALQPAQAALAPCLLDETYAGDLCRHEAYAGIEGGRVVGAAGVVPVWRGCHAAWALLSEMPLRQMVEVTGLVRMFAGDFSGRLETWVDASRPGHGRWAEKLGFEREGLMKRFLPSGGDAWLYARVK